MSLLSRLVSAFALVVGSATAAGARPAAAPSAPPAIAAQLVVRAPASRPTPGATLERAGCPAPTDAPGASESADDCTDPIREPHRAEWPAVRAGARVTLRAGALVAAATRMPLPPVAAALDAPDGADTPQGAATRPRAGPQPSAAPDRRGRVPYLPTAPPARP